MSTKPNILFLLADDQRYNTIGALGNKEIRTPNLDRLVNKGCAFTQAHIMGGTCGAVCMPSRAMLNTGRTLFHIEGEGQNIPTEHVTIGETLQQAGYNTCGIGKWHNGIESYARSFNSGANIFFGGMWDHWNVPICYYNENGEYNNFIKYTSNFWYGNKTMEAHCDRIPAGKHSTELMAEAAIDYISNYNDDKPFYMYVSFLAPHDPRTMPDEFKNMYSPNDITIPENFAEMHTINYGIRDMRDEMLTPYPRTKSEVKQHIADYYAMISHLDNAIGRVLKSLEDKGQLDNTIIIYAADNGLAVGCHGLMGKQSLYEHSVRVPLIFAGAGMPHGKVIDKYAYLLDVFPTLCDVCNIVVPETVEGKSLMPSINEDKTIRDTLYIAYADRVRGVKDDRYKLIEYRTTDMNATQLFDLENDPNELNDLSESTEHYCIKQKLSNTMLKYNKEYDDEKHRVGKGFWENYNDKGNIK